MGHLGLDGPLNANYAAGTGSSVGGRGFRDAAQSWVKPQIAGAPSREGLDLRTTPRSRGLISRHLSGPVFLTQDPGGGADAGVPSSGSAALGRNGFRSSDTAKDPVSNW
jgi:hypothetical protein